MRVRFTKVSSNTKTGPIGVTMTESASCPDTCSLKGAGCYARFGRVGMQWKQLDNGTYGMQWDDFIHELSAMPRGYTFRHNVSGDLPHDNGRIDAVKLVGDDARSRWCKHSSRRALQLPDAGGPWSVRWMA